MAEVKIIGQMDNTIDHTFESANRVYDVGGVSPTINTCGGGGLQPKILEDMNPRLLGGIGEKWGNKQYRQGNRVYDSNGVAMALTAQPLGNNGGNSYMYLTEEKSIVAMRGGNPNNPSDRTVGAPTEQRLEPNSQGICNTLTSVQKDNLVMEKVKIKQATKDGYIECDVGGVADLSFPDSKTRRGRVQENGQVSPTLMAGESDICRIEKKCISTKGKENEVASTILAGYERTNMTGFNADNGVVENHHMQYRIRKLTPRECWRLMDFKDEDFEKAAQVNSNTQLYKQAGNSICRNVIIAILGQMIPGKEDVYKEINNVKT